jgi:prolipoprotein diacylglyceryltransferase
MCFSLFLALWFLRKRIHMAGLLFSLYLIFNGIERFFIEKIRIDSEYHFFNLHFKQATFISVLILISALFLAGYSLRQNYIRKQVKTKNHDL